MKTAQRGVSVTIPSKDFHERTKSRFGTKNLDVVVVLYALTRKHRIRNNYCVYYRDSKWGEAGGGYPHTPKESVVVDAKLILFGTSNTCRLKLAAVMCFLPHTPYSMHHSTTEGIEFFLSRKRYDSGKQYERHPLVLDEKALIKVGKEW